MVKIPKVVPVVQNTLEALASQSCHLTTEPLRSCCRARDRASGNLALSAAYILVN